MNHETIASHRWLSGLLRACGRALGSILVNGLVILALIVPGSMGEGKASYQYSIRAQTASAGVPP